MKKVIIHSVEKILKTVDVTKSNKIYNIENHNNEKLNKLINDISYNFSKDIKHGVFVSTNKPKFVLEFEKAIGKKEFDLLNFSQNVLQDLKRAIDKQNFAKGGYIFFYLQDNSLDIYIVRDKKGRSFTFINNEVVISDVIYLDTMNVNMACRIDLLGYKNKSERYLSFVSNQKEDVSKYFLEWIGTEISSNNDLDFKYLEQIVRTITLPQDENGNDLSREKVYEMVFENCSKNYSRNVNIKSLGSEIWGNENAISEFANIHNIPISNIFTVSQKELKNIKKVSLNRDGIILKFSKELYQKKIYIDENGKTKIIIESDKLAKQLKEVINEWN